MKKLLYVFIFGLTLIKLTSPADADCEAVQNTTATQQICTPIVVEDPMKFCCFVTFKEKVTNKIRTQCKLLENTQFAINNYKDTLSNFKNLKILCSAQRNIRLLSVIYIIGILMF